MSGKDNLIQLGDGWTRDKITGEVRDPDGYVWYGHTISSDQTTPSGIIKSTEDAVIADPGQGEQRVLKFFRCKMPPGKELPPKEDVFKAMYSNMMNHLWRCGLTTDDNHSPILHQDSEAREYLIVLTCKPSKTRAHIYEGMKSGEGAVMNVDGQQVIAHRTDNISTLLGQKPKNML